jgi:hypothetical protein
MAFSVPFILTWVEVGNGNLVEPFLTIEATTIKVPNAIGA